MKYVKILALAASAAMAIAALLGVGGASATVLCSTTTNPCTSDFASGTEIKAELVKETESFFKAAATTVSCKKSSFVGTTSNTGVEFFSVLGSFSSLSFTECSHTAHVLSKGSFGISWALGGRGEFWGKGSEVTLGLFGTSCTYGTGEGTTLGISREPTLNTSHTTLPVLAWLKKTAGSFLCPSEASWSAEYTITTPAPLYVANT